MFSPAAERSYQLIRECPGRHRSKVFEALRRSDGISCVVKFVRKSLLRIADTQALRSEFSLLSSLHHPNLVRVFDFGEDSDWIWLVSEKVEGLPFDAVDPTPPEESLLNWCKALLDTLAYLHDRGIIHHDIKPANVLLQSGTSDIKLIDLGLSLARYVRRSDDPLRGTIGYLAPELFASGTIDQRVDLYAVGALFRNIAREPSPSLLTWMNKMTASNPEERFVDACAAAAALVGSADGTPRLEPYLLDSLPWSTCRKIFPAVIEVALKPDVRILLRGKELTNVQRFSESVQTTLLARGIARPAERIFCASDDTETPQDEGWKVFSLAPFTEDELSTLLSSIHPEVILDRPVVIKILSRTRGVRLSVRQLLGKMLISRPTPEEFRRNLVAELVSTERDSEAGDEIPPPIDAPPFHVLAWAREPLPIEWFKDVLAWRKNNWVRSVEKRGVRLLETALPFHWKELLPADRAWLVKKCVSASPNQFEVATALSLRVGETGVAQTIGSRVIRSLLRRRHLEEALVWVDRLLPTVSANIHSWERLRTRLLLECGNLRKAKEALSGSSDKRLLERLAFLEGRYEDCSNSPEAWILKGKAKKALDWAVEKLSRPTLIARHQAELKRIAGFASIYCGDLKNAHEHLLASRKLWREVNDPRGFAATLNLLGMVFTKKEDFRRAARAYRHAMEIVAGIGDRKRSLSYRFNFATAQLEMGGIESALRNFEACRAAFWFLGLSREWGRLTQSVAYIWLRIGHFDRCLRLLNEIETWVETAGTPDLRLYQQILRADLALSVGDQDRFLSLVDVLAQAKEQGRFATAIATLSAEAAFVRGEREKAIQLLAESADTPLHRALLESEWEWKAKKISKDELLRRYRQQVPPRPDLSSLYYLRFLGLLRRALGRLPADLEEISKQMKDDFEKKLPPEMLGPFQAQLRGWFDVPQDRKKPHVSGEISTLGGGAKATLKSFLETTRKITESENPETVIQEILRTIMNFAGVPRSAIVLRRGDELEPYIFLGADWQKETEIPRELSRTVAKAVIESGQPLFHPDLRAAAPSGVFGASIMSNRIRGVACLPLRARRETIGAIYLDDPENPLEFTGDDLPLLAGIADQAALTFQMARLLEDLRKENRRVNELCLRVTDLNLTLEKGMLDQNEKITALESRRPRHMGKWEEFGIFGTSASLRQALTLAEKVKGEKVPVLFVGEPGTGKKTLARAVAQAGEPFVIVDCPAIPPHLFESELFGYEAGAFTGAVGAASGLLRAAGKGTLLLDSVASLPHALQVKLLRVLQENLVRPLGSTEEFPLQARVLATVDREPKELIASGILRDDLYYRLAVVEIVVPPLRERTEDIPYLVRHALSEIATREGVRRRVSRGVLDRFQRYSWPGNLVEFFNELERAAVVSEGTLIDLQNLSDHLRFPAVSIKLPRRKKGEKSDIRVHMEREAILRALQETEGNSLLAADRLGIPRTTFYRKLKKYRLNSTAAVRVRRGHRE